MTTHENKRIREYINVTLSNGVTAPAIRIKRTDGTQRIMPDYVSKGNTFFTEDQIIHIGEIKWTI